MRLEQATFLGVDVQGFGRRNNDGQRVVRRQLFPALLGATRGSTLRRRAFLDEGDGGIIILKPRAPAYSRLIDEVIPQITEQANKNATDPIRLRFIVHEGEAIKDRHGWTGNGLGFAFRALQSVPLRRYQQQSTESLAVMAVSEVAYRQIEPTGWTPLMVRNKEVEAQMWARQVHVQESLQKLSHTRLRYRR